MQSNRYIMPKPKYSIPIKYLKSARGGRQVDGWEGVNLEMVARAIGVGGQYLRNVIRGERNGSIWLWMRLGEVLEWTGGESGVGKVSEIMRQVERRTGKGVKGVKLRQAG